MFSRKSKTQSVQPLRSETGAAKPPSGAPRPTSTTPAQQGAKPPAGKPASPGLPPHKAKPRASVLSPDILLKGNLRTSGDVQIEGTVEGDVRAHVLTVGESAKIIGEVVADDVVINGRVEGTIRGVKVRLTSTAQVVGDVIHKTIAIESGAHFEGSASRQEKPLEENRSRVVASGQPPPSSPSPR